VAGCYVFSRSQQGRADGSLLWPHYSNVCRGRRKKAQTDDQTSYILEPELTDKAFRQNWSRLIQKIYETDPLTCGKCQGPMRVIVFVEDEAIVKKILKHLGI